MDNERLESSPTAVKQDDTFFTPESYNKYSGLPSFVEFLGKHIALPKDAYSDSESGCFGNSWMRELPFMSEGNNVHGSKKVPASISPVSKISIEKQKLLLDTLQIIKCRELAQVDLQKMQAVQDIKMEVLKEQEEFQKFVYNYARTQHHLYNYVQPDGWDMVKAKIEGKLKEASTQCSPQYSLHETIGLSVGAVFKSDAVLTFEQTLLQVGNVPVLSLPASADTLLSENTQSVSLEDKEISTPTAVVSEDPVAIDLARRHKVDIVISSSGLNTLLDNHAPDYRAQWQLPVTVQRLEGETQDQCSDHRVVFIDKPLPPQNIDPRTVNWKYYKLALRKLVCAKICPENMTMHDGLERNTSLQVVKTKEDENAPAVAISDSKTTKRRAESEESELKELKKPKMAKSSSNPKVNSWDKERVSSVTDERGRYFSYNLWKFGKLKILIRCSVDAYRADHDKPNSLTFFSVLPKLEYLSLFGHEKFTPSETARLWLHGYTRPQTKIICGRINVFNSALLRADELSLNDVLLQGTDFNPARGMKMIFHVFTALKRLPESKFMLSHKSGEIHSCLYKSSGLSNSTSKSSFHVHEVKTPVIINFSEANIPWVPIDCNLFLPWQIRNWRIPCTFPAVLEKDLALMAQKEQEAKAKKSKTSKKKGNKKKKQNANRFTPREPKPEHAAQPSGITGQDRKFHKRKQQGGKPVDKRKLFSSFYKTQPVEKESEVFSLARRASSPITYDDIEF